MKIQTDEEIKEALKKKTFSQKDLDRHTLKHKEDKDLKHLHFDEGY